MLLEDVVDLGNSDLYHLNRRGMAAYMGKDVSKLKAKGGGKWKYMSEADMLKYSEKFSPYRYAFLICLPCEAAGCASLITALVGRCSCGICGALKTLTSMQFKGRKSTTKLQFISEGSK